MRLTLIALGQRMPAWVDAGVADYAKRLPRELGFSLIELRPAPRGQGRPPAQLLADEARRIDEAAGDAEIVALDERGEAWTTRALADRLARWRDEQARIALVIGSADGLDAGLRARARARVALSAMTLPHGLCRVLAVEQLYRASSLLAGHPYHRE